MFHYFTIKFHFSFFASFRFKFFASLHLSNFCFEAKQSEAKFKSIFSLFFAFFTFSLFFAFFGFVLVFFVFNFSSLRFDLVIFASKRNKTKRNSSLFFCFFRFFKLFCFFCFFSLFSLFSPNFRFASIFSLNFCLFYLRFRFRFLVFLTIWARQTLHSVLLLSLAEDLSLKVLSLHHPVLKWDLFTNLLSLYGRRVRRTGTAGCTSTP